MLRPTPSTFRINSQPSTLSMFEDAAADAWDIPGKTWIEKVRTAFNEVDDKQNGQLTIQQFCRSRLRFLIMPYRLDEMQMEDYFRQIDSNCDDIIQWSELVDFLMCLQKSLGGGGLLEKTIKITYLAPSELIAKKHNRTSTCLKAMFIPALGQVAALNETQLTFYSIGDCVPVNVFQDRDNFVDFTYMPCIYKIAIAKQNRQVIFYDVRNNEKDPFFISATLDANAVMRMSISEANIASQWCHRRRIPLFNTPCAICSVPDQPTLLIGDDTGKIEVFTMFTSRETKLNWQANRVCSMKMHEGGITQMDYHPTIEKYISSSTDGTIAIWRYNDKTHKIQRDYLFREPQNLGIRSYIYDVRTRDVVYTTAGHCFGVWRTYTTHQQTIETNSQLISTQIIYQMNFDNSFLISITKENFVSVYRMPEMELTRSWYMGIYHDMCPPTGCLIVDKHLYLVGAFMSCWQLESSECDGLRPHVHRMVHAYANDIFRLMISVDRHGVVNTWNILNGKKEFSYDLHENRSKVLCAALDLAKRRMGIGYSDGRLKIVSSNSGSVLCEIDKKYIERGCVYIKFAMIFAQKRFLACTGAKTIVMFEDMSGNRWRFARSFVGHQEPMSMVTVLKGNLILSIGMEHEMFLWNVQQQNPVIRYQMPDDPTVAADLVSDPDMFIVGDVCGLIHFMSRKSPTPVSSINPFGMSVRSAITALEIPDGYPLVVAGNQHGYVKYWMLDGSELKEIRRFRAHTESVVSVSVSPKFKTVVTMGNDAMIRQWSIEPFGLIGSFGTGTNWKMNRINTWESKEPLEDDPMHFVDREKAAREAALRAAEEEEEEKDEPVKVPEIRIAPFCLGDIEKLMDSVEEVCLSGRNQVAKRRSQIMPPEFPLTTRPRTVNTYMNREPDFSSIIRKRNMANTIRRMNNLTQGKIVRPKTAV